jgi:hypothetical protein
MAPEPQTVGVPENAGSVVLRTALGATDPISTSLKVVAIALIAVYMPFLYYVKYKIDIIE